MGIKILNGILVVAAATAGSAAAEPLHYIDALKLAKEHSLSIQQAQVDHQIAKNERALANNANDPELTLRAVGSTAYQERSGKTANVKDQAYTLSLGVPIYDFGRTASAREQLDHKERAAQLSVMKAEEKMTLDLARSFLAVVTARRTLQVSVEQLAIAEKKSSALRENYKIGLRPESDVVQAEVDEGRARMNHQSADRQLTTARLRLATLLGVTSVEIHDAALRERAPDALLAVVKQWKLDKPNRDDEIFSAELNALSAELSRVQATRRPTLSATLSAQESGQLEPLQGNASAALQLSWALPWSNMTRKEEEGVAFKRRTLELSQENAVRMRSEVILQGIAELNASDRQWVLLKNQLELSNRQVQLMQNRYETGKASALEVSAAQSSVLSVSLDLIKLMHEATIHALDIAAVSGVTDVGALLE